MRVKLLRNFEIRSRRDRRRIPRQSGASLGRGTWQGRTSLGRCDRARPHISRRCRTIRARKPDQGGLYRARNRVRPGPDLPALIALRSNDQRTYSVPQSGGAWPVCWQICWRWQARLRNFLKSRFVLVAQESKTALVQLLVLAACLILALFLCVLGYVFLISSAIVGLAHLARVSWLWTALAAAGVHFLIALVLLLVARSRITKTGLSRDTG